MLDTAAGVEEGPLGLSVTFIYRNKPAHTVTIEVEQLDRFLARYSPDNSCIGYLVMRHGESRGLEKM